MREVSETNARKAAARLPEEILGNRVLLRPYRPGDGEALWAAIESSRDYLRPWLPWVDKTRSVEDAEENARRMSARWLLREDLTLGIWHRETGNLLGGSGLHRIDWSVPRFEIGYWLRQSAEGQGYMSETVRLLCRTAFDLLEAKRVEIRCDTRNVRSAAVPRRLGFPCEGTLRNNGRSTDGELHDTYIFAMTDTDYRKMR